ncbi:MAG: [protein-PII] uridylyltransferase [Alphaproteobacteria bacterium]|nr:[protein-PII] uridylyltransferase [Alphaproteobacteria bacterium]
MTVEALPRAFDGEAMRHDLTAVAKRHAGDDAAIKAEALNLFRTALLKGRERAKAKLEAGAPGLVVARDLSDLQDALIGALYDFTVKHIYYAQNPTAAERVAVVAVGGYGRGLLAPGSDVDLLFLLPYKQTPWGESVVEYMLYMLWDLGLTVGHATRSLDECIRLAKGDMTIRTSLLEARYLWGDAALCAQMKARFWREVATGSGIDFVDAKLGERDGRHRLEGESRYRVEPNIKDGKGGMRDLNTLFWIAKYLYRVEDPRDLVLHGVFTEDEFETFASAERFLWNVRCHLHFLAGRAEERLTFDVQREMAIRMGYGEDPKNRSVERFMTDYFRVAKDVGDLTRIFSASLETQRRKSAPVLDRWFGAWMRRRVLQEGFFVEGGRLNVEEPTLFEKDPVNLLRLFALADERSVDIHPAALKAVTRSLHLIDDRLRANKEANRLFMAVLSSPRGPERILRLMNEAGVFGAFIPDFGRIVARMQFNMYHHYTVDEHLIRAVGNLSLIERGELRDEHPLAAEIIHKIHSREALYLSVLLHDIAKGRDEDHSIAGERVAYELGPRLGLSDADTETVAWLVLNHLVMSDTAQRRDIADPKTVRDFVSVVQSPERLKLLVCLTVADIRAVGPGVWNGWKGQLLRELYYAAEAMMLGGHAAGSRAARIQEAKKALGDRLRSWPAKWRSRMLERQYDPYWLTFDVEEHERHARLMRAAEEEKRPLAMDAVSDDFQSITRVTIYTADHPGLFSRLSGALALAGASILEAKIFTTTDGMALDTFFIQDAEGQPIDEGTRLKRIETALDQALSGEVALTKAFACKRVRPREAAFKVEPRVIIDNEASDICTVIEVNGRDRPGLLHDLTRTLFHVSVSIHSAQIATYGERAIDVFYVKDAYGMKVLKEQRLAAIKEALLEALGDGGIAPEPSEPAAPGGKPAREAK